jgi:hypothetical protein
MKEAIIDYVKANEGCSCAQICKEFGINPRQANQVWTLKNEGLLFVGGPRKKQVYATTKAKADEIDAALFLAAAEHHKAKQKQYYATRMSPEKIEARRAWEREHYQAKKAAGVVKKKPVKPTPIVFAKPRLSRASARGPAHLDVPVTYSPDFKYTVAKAPPAPTRSNIFSSF